MYAAYLIKRALEEASSSPNLETLKYPLTSLALLAPGYAGVVGRPKLFGNPYTEHELNSLRSVLGAENVRIIQPPGRTWAERLAAPPFFASDPLHHRIPDTAVVSGVHSPALLAHELGHLTGYRRLLVPYAISSMLNLPMLPMSAYLAHAGGRGAKTEEEAIRGGAGRGALLGAVVGLPRLAEEARASWRASQALRKIKARQLVRGHLGLLSGWLTYPASTIGLHSSIGALAGRLGFSRERKLPEDLQKVQEASRVQESA